MKNLKHKICREWSDNRFLSQFKEILKIVTLRNGKHLNTGRLFNNIKKDGKVIKK